MPDVAIHSPGTASPRGPLDLVVAGHHRQLPRGDCDLSKVKETMGDKPHPGKDRTSDSFGFAGHSDPVMFRDISIRRLP